MGQPTKNTSLRAKIVLILSVVVLLYAGIDHAIQQIVVRNSFVALEQKEACKDLQRVVQAIRNEIHHLDVRCADWAAWDDTYRFVDDANAEYIRSNLGESAFRKNNLDLLYICAEPKRNDKDAKRDQYEVVWNLVLDPTSKKPVVLRDFPREVIALIGALGASEREPERNIPTAGLLMTERGPMLVCAKRILKSDGSGPQKGAVIMGRFVGAAVLRSLVQQTGVDFNVWSVEDEALPEGEERLLDEVTSAEEPVLRAQSDEVLHAYTTFLDIRTSPALLIRANVARVITARGDTAARYALISTIAAGLLILLVLLNLLQRAVLKPIAALTQQAVALGRSEDFSKKLKLDRQDEIGILSREFDAMMEKLAQSRADVVKAARAAGMSEIATGVLHNVGNVLNSVNVSATLVADKAKNSPVADLQLAMAAVKEGAGDLASFLANDPRGEHLYPLLLSLSDELGREQQSIVGEVKTLTEGIEHIKELIQAQQSYAGRSGVRETLELSELIESALSMTGQAASGGGELDIVREYEDIGPCAVDRHRLLEVLVNLIQNARQAMQSAEVAHARLTLRVARVNAGRVRVEIADSGVGIPRENLSRIFNHGFTTKKTGHGFGLHASANSATEMGGSLTVRSDGVGQGATFILELPMRASEESALAGAIA